MGGEDKSVQNTITTHALRNSAAMVKSVRQPMLKRCLLSLSAPSQVSNKPLWMITKVETS